MNNFKPGDRAIFVGPIRNPNLHEYIREGDEVTVLGPSVSRFNGIAGYLIDILCANGFYLFALPQDLRKPDDYHITEQDWYQRILRGERLEETA